MNKKHFSYIFAVLICALVSLCALTACGDDDSSPEVKLEIGNGMNSIAFSSEAGQIEMNIFLQNTDFKTEVVEGAEWISVLRSTKDKIIISANENLLSVERTGTVRIIATANPKIYSDIKVTQQGQPESIKANGTDLMFTLISNDEDLDCADFIVTHITGDGETTVQTITKNDFKTCDEEYFIYGINGSAKIKLGEGEKYWQIVEHADNYDVHSIWCVQYVAKKSHKFHSTAGLSVQTTKDNVQLDSSLKTMTLNAQCNVVNIGGESTSYPKTYWFGYGIDVDPEGIITVASKEEDELKRLSNTQYAYLAECVNGLVDNACADIDDIIAALPDDDESVNNETFIYTSKMPAALFEEKFDIALEIAPYAHKTIYYFTKVKKEAENGWSSRVGTISKDRLEEQLNDPEFRKKLIRNFEITIYDVMRK